MKLKHIIESRIPKTFYHGSMTYLPEGTILTPTTYYAQNWGGSGFYEVLEFYRPKNKLGHHQSVFMVGDEDDVDIASGGSEYLLIVEPMGHIQKHDMNWSSEISMIMDYTTDILDYRFEDAAYNYWNGISHYNESIWEFLTPKAKVLHIEEF